MSSLLQPPKKKKKRNDVAAAVSLKTSKKRQRAEGNNDTSRKQKQEQQTEPSPPPPNVLFGNCINVSERFKKICRIGEGTYGVVYKAEDKMNSGDYVALKRCIPHHQATDGFPTTAIREIYALRLLQHHPNVISLRTDITTGGGGGGMGGGVAVNNKNDTFLVFEYCQFDLAQLLDHHNHNQQQQQQQQRNRNLTATTTTSPFRETHVKTLLKQLLSALECMHENRLIHRDLKVSNLLYSSETGTLKLADFGLSRSLPPTSSSSSNNTASGDDTDIDNGDAYCYHMTPNVVSLWYRPPELLLGSKKYNQKIDLFGVGCVFAELLQGFPLFGCCKTETEQINAIFNSLGKPTKEIWPTLYQMPLIQNGTIDLLSSQQQQAKIIMPLLDSFSFLSTSGLLLLSHLLHYDPNQRLSATQALQSNYWESEPLPTPPTKMPKFRSLHK